MDIQNTKFKELLKEKGHKLTTQRRAILDIIHSHEGEHLSTEEIYDLVKPKCPEIGLATVYRTLQLLEEMKIIYKLNFDDGCSRYELNSNENEHKHHHLICDQCGKVLEVEEDLLDNIEAEISKKYDFNITDHKVKFYGICKDCSK